MTKSAIIGFGGAGYSAACEIRRRDSGAGIDVYSDTDIGPYNPMLTTYYVKGSIPYDAMFPYGSIQKIRAELGISFFGNTPVKAIIPNEKKLKLPEGTEKAYDNILVSTGASAVVPSLLGIDLPGVFKMRTADDAVQLKKRIEAGKIRSALIIGASWVGIKVVEDMVSHDVGCTLEDGAPWMFYVAAFEETAKRIQQNLEAKGISVSCGQMLSHIEQEQDGRLTAIMQNGQSFTADTIAICVGVRMNTGFVRNSGINMNRGIIVDSRMRTNCEGIYAAGDCCEAADIQSGTPRNIGVWFNANKQGLVAGNNMSGGDMEFDANVLVNLAHYLNYDFISVGDVSSCKPNDNIYEYEDKRYYIRAVKDNGGIKCINIINSAESNGLIKNLFIKSIKNKNARMDVRSACYLLQQGFPVGFLDFLGGIDIA
ncbi:MAG: FAD-dependent oxidoreductase [Eubacteriales bacterium]|nr:FAD-dependent oxidoreductase [Eubacteriales bacterium]